MMWLVAAHALPAPIRYPPTSGPDDMASCWKDAVGCSVAADSSHLEGFHAQYWYYRREIAVRYQRHGAPKPVRRPRWEMTEAALREWQEFTLDVHDNIVDHMNTGDRAGATMACELGDVGSCLLDTLDQLVDPATHEQALADLGDQCARGSASACAWRLEHVRLHDREDQAGFQGALAYAQRACIELYEPVACAASSKALAGVRDGWRSAAVYDDLACGWGYAPSCSPDADRTLTDEAPPQLVGATMLDQTSAREPLPLPGRPGLPPKRWDAPR